MTPELSEISKTFSQICRYNLHEGTRVHIANLKEAK